MKTRSKGLEMSKTNSRKQMMNDMGINDAMEQMAADPAKVSINSSQSTLDIGPALCVVVMDIRVVVVQVSDGN